MGVLARWSLVSTIRLDLARAQTTSSDAWCWMAIVRAVRPVLSQVASIPNWQAASMARTTAMGGFLAHAEDKQVRDRLSSCTTSRGCVQQRSNTSVHRGLSRSIIRRNWLTGRETKLGLGFDGNGGEAEDGEDEDDGEASERNDEDDRIDVGRPHCEFKRRFTIASTSPIRRGALVLFFMVSLWERVSVQRRGYTTMRCAGKGTETGAGTESQPTPTTAQVFDTLARVRFVLRRRRTTTTTTTINTTTATTTTDNTENTDNKDPTNNKPRKTARNRDTTTTTLFASNCFAFKLRPKCLSSAEPKYRYILIITQSNRIQARIPLFTHLSFCHVLPSTFRFRGRRTPPCQMGHRASVWAVLPSQNRTAVSTVTLLFACPNGG